MHLRPSFWLRCFLALWWWGGGVCLCGCVAECNCVAVWLCCCVAVRVSTDTVIAHRLSTVVNADKIVVLKGGEMVECGRHQDLLQVLSFFARCARLHSTRLSCNEGETTRVNSFTRATVSFCLSLSLSPQMKGEYYSMWTRQASDQSSVLQPSTLGSPAAAFPAALPPHASHNSATSTLGNKESEAHEDGAACAAQDEKGHGGGHGGGEVPPPARSTGDLQREKAPKARQAAAAEAEAAEAEGPHSSATGSSTSVGRN